MRCRTIRPSDVPSLLRLWLDSFSEKREAAELFFERNLFHARAYLAEENSEVIAAVYLVKCVLCGKPSHYLCGAATRRDRRGRGVMSALLSFALTDAARHGDCYSVLLPADEGLYRFYGRFGYQTGGAVCRRELAADGGTAAYDAGAALCQTGEPPWEALQQRCGGNEFLLWNKDFIRFAATYYACYGVRVLQTARVFALYEQNGGSAAVFYAIYNDLEELKSLLFRRGVRRFTLTGSAGNPDLAGCAPQICGMVKALRGGLPVPGSVWIGLTLN